MPERLPYERAITALGMVTAALLSLNGAWVLALETLTATAALAAVARAADFRASSTAWLRFRMVATYAWALWFYLSVARFIPAMGRAPMDDLLLSMDRALLGETPAVAMQPMLSPLSVQLLSACYLSYLFYLHGCLLHALVSPQKSMVRLARMVFPAWVVGYAGYLLVPARGPGVAFPTLFDAPLPGGTITDLNARMVADGSSVFDVFPSLHVLITLVLLTHDARHVRARFLVMMLPACGLFISTMALRFHYAVDVLAAVVVWAAGWRPWQKARRTHMP